MKNDVYIRNTKVYEYNNNEIFNPSKCYPEGLDIDIKSDGKIYDEIRNLFIDMKLDNENIGNKNWNPFKDFIKKNDKVVIKPNLVENKNPLKDAGTDCLITNFSIMRPIIDYVIKALEGTGEIVLGDAPLQDCIFSEVIKLNGLEEAIKVYNSNNYKIRLADFRNNNNPDAKSKIVSLGKDSSLVDVDKYWKKYAITNYNLKYMHEHHHDGIHEYLIAEEILNADVIINLPKPKTHRKAGITACMKNFVGANGKKEYLPHHRNGSVHSHGDEYPERSFIKFCKSNVKNYSYKKSKVINTCIGGFAFLEKVLRKNRYREGSWYGNDTIWRTVLDLNKIVLYANKDGKMTDKIQRVIFNVADMIVSGEKEGPLEPSPKKVGLIVGGFNQLNVDKAICQIMGFEVNKIKGIVNGYKLKKYVISENDNFEIYERNEKVDIEKYNQHFIPTDGWADYLLDKK